MLYKFTHPKLAGMLGSFDEIDKENFELKHGLVDNPFSYLIALGALCAFLTIFNHY